MKKKEIAHHSKSYNPLKDGSLITKYDNLHYNFTYKANIPSQTLLKRTNMTLNLKKVLRRKIIFPGGNHNKNTSRW